MAIKFQYNKTSLNELNKQLKIRTRALPTLKNKESALRMEVKKAKERSESLVAQLDAELKSYEYMARLWNEFEPDFFFITGRGTVATGRVERGVVHVGDEVDIVGIKEAQKSTVTGVEMFRKQLDEGRSGDNIGALLRGIDRTQIERGQVLAAPGSIHPHTHFTAQVYVLTKEEGGRHTPFFDGYRPQFYFRTTDVTGDIKLPEGVEMVCCRANR